MIRYLVRAHSNQLSKQRTRSKDRTIFSFSKIKCIFKFVFYSLFLLICLIFSENFSRSLLSSINFLIGWLISRGLSREYESLCTNLVPDMYQPGYQINLKPYNSKNEKFNDSGKVSEWISYAGWRLAFQKLIKMLLFSLK